MRLTRSSPGPNWQAWFIWGVGVTAYMLAVVNRSSLSAVGVDTAERFGADAATLSMFAVVQLAVYGGMQIPVGLLLDRYGARPIMAIGMVLMALGQLTLAFSPASASPSSRARSSAPATRPSFRACCASSPPGSPLSAVPS